MSNYLEIDSKILEKNLLLRNDSPDADNLENFFRSPENYIKDNPSWKLVTPTAGLCVKTTDSNNKKVFINLCKVDDIPEPRDITEAELLELWQSDDVPDYRIPLSIQEPHDEFDKSGNPAVAYDVAVNAKFFLKIQTNAVFRSFVMQVVMEGLENKYSIELKKEGMCKRSGRAAADEFWETFSSNATSYVILQNRKSLGELRPHRIRTNKSGASSKPLIEELHSTKTPSASDILKKDSRKTPAFRLFENSHRGVLIAEFYLPNVVIPQDLTLDVSEDRIVLDSQRGLYFADIFIPIKINETETTASFDSSNKILIVEMPIISAKE